MNPIQEYITQVQSTHDKYKTDVEPYLQEKILEKFKGVDSVRSVQFAINVNKIKMHVIYNENITLDDNIIKNIYEKIHAIEQDVDIKIDSSIRHKSVIQDGMTGVDV